MSGTWTKFLGVALLVATAGIVAAAVARIRAEEICGKHVDPDLSDPVDLYIDESFPASDPPSFTPVTQVGGTK